MAAKFKVVFGSSYDKDKVVEATSFQETGSYTVFYSAANEQVFAIPTQRVDSIEAVIE